MKDKTLLPRQFLVPFVLVTALFSLWGFANDITNPMVAAFSMAFSDVVVIGNAVRFRFKHLG